MGKRAAIFQTCALFAIAVGIAKGAGAQQNTSQSQAPAKVEGKPSEKAPQEKAVPEKAAPQDAALDKGSGSAGNVSDSKAPSLKEYQFSEALKKLESGDRQKLPRSKATVPPLTVLPLAPAGPRSKDVPKDFVPNKDVVLNATGLEAVSVSREWQDAENIPAAGKDGRVLYVYGAGMPVVVCSPLRICVVELEAGEKLVGEPQVGDSVRWEISPAMAGSGENARPLIVLKPTAAGLDTTMMVPTDRRAYYLRLESKPGQYLARVAFSYPEEQGEQWKRFTQQQDAARPPKTEKGDGKVLPSALDVVYWDYAIKGGDPTMRPTHVLDDGTKTYIQMPVATGKTEAPVLIVQGPDGGEMVNYRVKGDVYVVDRLFNRGALIVGAGKHAKKVEIRRKTAIGADKESRQEKKAEQHATEQGNGS